MRRIGLIIIGALVLAWAIAAIALDSPSLKLASSGGATAMAPECIPSTLAHSATLPGTGVDVSPEPGTDTANPDTQISFLGVPAGRIHAVSVVGERSGAHGGSLRAYSQGDGASFVPDTPFDAGERVTVHVTLGPPSSSGSASGSSSTSASNSTPASGSTPASASPSGATHTVAYSFRVDVPYPTAGASEFPNPPAAPADYESFATLPGAQPPVLHVTVPDRDPAAGDILTSNGPGPGQYGPLIYTPQGNLVWFDHLPPGETAEDVKVQSYEGRRDLTWWRGRVLSLGFGQGEDVVMNRAYQVVARVHGGNGLRADLHDFQIVSPGIAYVTAFNPIRCDLSHAEGPRDGVITDTAIQEIDMRTGLVRWEWHSLDHVGVGESETSPSGDTPWDWFHLNSIDPLPDGDLFISARSTWAGYMLQGGSGRILWRLGGSHSSFKMGPGTRTAWQHDGRVLPDGQITFFDDGSNPPEHSQSRGVRIELDMATHEARLVKSFDHPDPPLLAASQGNMQTLANENAVVGYGAVPEITEYAPDGEVLFDAHMSYDLTFYRAYRQPWSGRPLTPPTVLADANNTEEETIVHMSWNGATGVAAWRVLAGPRRGALRPQATVPAGGFETTTILPRRYGPTSKRYGYFAVQALDAAGQVLSTSHAVGVSSYDASLPGG